MRGIELVLNGVAGEHETLWGIDLYVNSSGELKLYVTTDDLECGAQLNVEQARALAEALREYVNGEDENSSAD